MSEIGARVVAERYRLVGELGRGGMGRVWAARDELLGRDVAVKELVLPAGMAPEDKRDLAERTIREARAIARLDHRNVVRIFDVIFADNRPWIVMELVRSRSLFEVVNTDGPMPPEQVARVGLEVLEALRAAHRAGILHRDVKPANVLLGFDGRVVLTDFGLATAAGDSSMTSTGIVLGSPSYLAPERTLDGEIGPAADLWSLGATLYAAVEGRPPYAKSSPMATLAALATEPPAPPVQAGVMGPVLAALLERDPARRAGAAAAERLLREAAEEASTAPTRQYAYIARPEGSRPEQSNPQPSGLGRSGPGQRSQETARNRTRLRLLIAAAVIAILAAIVIAVRPSLTSASADELPSEPAGGVPSSADVQAPRTSTSPSELPAVDPAPPAKRHHSAPPVKPPTGKQLQNFRTGTCLDAPGTIAELKLWACQSIKPQLFTFPSDGTLRVRGRCVTVESTDDGARLKLAACAGGADQQFTYNASFDLVSIAADKCVDVPDGNPANNTPAQIWSCTGAANQKWHY